MVADINRWGIEASLRVPYELGAAGVLVWVDDEAILHTEQLKSVVEEFTGPIGVQVIVVSQVYSVPVVQCE
jgi:hypothetical protein